MTDGKVKFDSDFTKETGLSPTTNPTEYLLYCNVRLTAKLNDRIMALENSIHALGKQVEKLPEDFITHLEDRRRKRNTL